MSITPTFLDELRSRVPISEIAGRFVTWDQRKSQPARGDFWAPCPFHNEKTPSFHVDDTKGIYYCFGCHQKGDVIGFLKEKANMSFIEAVRELANHAGMEMPALQRESREVASLEARLIEMHEVAQRFFALNLASTGGIRARDYVVKTRKLTDATLHEFGIGFAPNARDALSSHLRDKGFSESEMISGGLVIKPDDGGQIYDRFRNRIIFPIHDLRGRIIAFGGRALDGNSNAKYLNSPESPIFHKGRIVYNLHRARNHVKKQDHILVAEGYMDVVALAQAGFTTGVAPMGTAITMEQIEAIWRIDGRPIIALDGDEAGQRAAKKLSLLALSKITPLHSLAFILLPDGLDPDEFLVKRGPDALQGLLDAPMPLVDILWQGALEQKTEDTPEARSNFDRVLRGLLKQISDPDLRKHYGEDFAERRKVLFDRRPRFDPTQTGKQVSGYGHPQRQTRPQRLAPIKQPHDLTLALLLYCLLNHPELTPEFTDELCAIDSSNDALIKLRQSILMAYDQPEEISKLRPELERGVLSTFSSLHGLRMTKETTPQEAVRSFLHSELQRINHLQAILLELGELKAEISREGLTESRSKHLIELMKEKEKIGKQKVNITDEEEDSASFLRQFLDQEAWRK